MATMKVEGFIIKLNYEFLLHLIKYLFVGGVNAILTFIIYFLFLKIFGVYYLISFSIAWISGVVFTYVINFLWVFKPEEKIRFKNRFIKYFIVYLTSYGTNMFLLKLVKEKAGLDPLIAQLFIIPIVVMINFLGIKYWSLRKY